MKGKGYIPEGDGSPALPVAFCTPSGGDAVPPARRRRPSATSGQQHDPCARVQAHAQCELRNGPTAFLWTGCTSTQGTCTTTQSTAGTATYTLYTANAQGPADPASVTVTWTTPGGGNLAPPGGGNPTPPQCALSATPRFPAIGTSVALSATCSQSPTSYQWLQCDPSNSEQLRADRGVRRQLGNLHGQLVAAGVTRYIVSGINGVGTGPFVAIDVEWQNSAALGGFCGQYERVKKVVIPWGDGSRYTTDVYGGFTGETVFVFQVTVPGSPSSYGTAGYTSLAEYRGPPAYRHMTLSKQPCDFRNPDPTGVNGAAGRERRHGRDRRLERGALPIGLAPDRPTISMSRSERSTTCDVGRLAALRTSIPSPDAERAVSDGDESSGRATAMPLPPERIPRACRTRPGPFSPGFICAPWATKGRRCHIVGHRRSPFNRRNGASATSA